MPFDPYAGDGRVCTPRLSVFTLSSASVRRGDHITQISPSHAHAPPPSPRGGKPTVRAARACVRCDDARRVGYAPLRPSRSTRCAGGAKTDQNRPFGEQPIHRRDYVTDLVQRESAAPRPHGGRLAARRLAARRLAARRALLTVTCRRASSLCLNAGIHETR